MNTTSEILDSAAALHFTERMEARHKQHRHLRIIGYIVL